MSNITVVVNCANVRTAQRRIQVANGDTSSLPYGAKFALNLLPVLETLEAEGKWPKLAKCLNELGLATPTGKRWGPVTVNRLMATLADVIRVSAWVRPS